MDKEMIKTDLLTIMKEAENLNIDALETIPGTDIKVKSGRVREFLRLCDNFYELEFNQKVMDDTDTVTPVYNFLADELLEEKGEYFASEAYSFVQDVTPEFDRFKALKKSLSAVDKAYKLTVKDLNDLYNKRSSGEEWQKSVDEKSAEIKRLGENTSILKEQLIIAKNNVNNILLSYVNKQMKELRDSFLKTSKDSNKALSVDNETIILTSDKEEYDSLYLLSQMLKVANAKDSIDDLVALDSFMIVTNDQKEVISSLLKNITLFAYVENPKKPWSDGLTPKDTNKLLIERINGILEEAETRGKREKSDNLVNSTEKNNLLEMLNILKRANDSKEELTPIFSGVAYVLDADASRFENLIRNSESLQNLHPNHAMRQENEQLMERVRKLIEKIDEVEKRENGISDNLKAEKKNLISILDLLEKANASKWDLTSVLGGKAHIISSDTIYFDNLIKNTQLLHDLNPDYERIQENDKLINDLYDYLNKLADKVTKYTGVANLPIVATKVLDDKAWIVTEGEDLEEANRIIDLIKLLKEQKNNLVSVWGIANVSYEDISKFKRIANATKYLGGKVPNVPANEEEMKKVHDALVDLIRKAKENKDGKLASNGLVLESDLETYKLLESKYKYLEEAKASDNLVPVDGGVQIDADHVANYLEINNKLEEILNPKKTKTPNEEELEKYQEALDKINQKANLTAEDIEERSILEELIAILNKAATSTNLVDVNGIKIDAEDETRYNELIAELENVRKPVDPFINNDKEIEAVKAEIKALEEKAAKSKRGKMAENGKVLQRDLKRYNMLLDKLKLLEEAKTSTNLVDVNGIKIDASHKDDYLAVDKKINKKKKRVLGIRKLKEKAKTFAKKHWKELICVGLGIAASIYILPSLIPTIIFANSCNAAAVANIPLIGNLAAGLFNTASSLIAPLAGIPFAPGVGLINVGVDASYALPSMLSALSKVGVIGLTGYGINKLRKLDEPNRLPDPQKKGIIDRLKGLIADLKNKDKELEQAKQEELINNPDVYDLKTSAGDLINAQMAYDVASSERDLTGEEKIELDTEGFISDVPIMDSLNDEFPQDVLEKQVEIDEIAKQISENDQRNLGYQEDVEMLDIEPKSAAAGAQTPVEGESVPQVVVPPAAEVLAQLDSESLAQDLLRLPSLRERLKETINYRDKTDDDLIKSAYQQNADIIQKEIERIEKQIIAYEPADDVASLEILEEKARILSDIWANTTGDHKELVGQELTSLMDQVERIKNGGLGR